MSEKAFENKLKKMLRQRGAYVVKYFGCAFTQAGVPDLLVCYKGHFLGLEIKDEKGRASDLQKFNIQEIQKAGGIAMIVYPKDYDALIALLDQIDKSLL